MIEDLRRMTCERKALFSSLMLSYWHQTLQCGTVKPVANGYNATRCNVMLFYSCGEEYRLKVIRPRLTSLACHHRMCLPLTRTCVTEGRDGGLEKLTWVEKHQTTGLAHDDYHYLVSLKHIQKRIPMKVDEP